MESTSLLLIVLLITGAGLLRFICGRRMGWGFSNRHVTLILPILIWSLALAGCQADTQKSGSTPEQTTSVSINTGNNSSQSDIYDSIISHYQAQGFKFSAEAADPEDSSLLITTAPGSDGKPDVIIQRQASDHSIYYCMVSSRVENKDDLKWVLTETLPAWSDSGSWVDKYAMVGEPKICMFEFQQADIYLASGGNSKDSQNLATLMIYPAGEKKN